MTTLLHTTKLVLIMAFVCSYFISRRTFFYLFKQKFQQPLRHTVRAHFLLFYNFVVCRSYIYITLKRYQKSSFCRCCTNPIDYQPSLQNIGEWWESSDTVRTPVGDILRLLIFRCWSISIYNLLLHSPPPHTYSLKGMSSHFYTNPSCFFQGCYLKRM